MSAASHQQWLAKTATSLKCHTLHSAFLHGNPYKNQTRAACAVTYCVRERDRRERFPSGTSSIMCSMPGSMDVIVRASTMQKSRTQ